MESIRIENLSFAYPNRSVKVLKNINLTVNKGEFVLICGKSGCGKTTLLRLLKPTLAPFGKSDGYIFFNGRQLSFMDTKEQASGIGFVMQNPDNQIVTDKVWHELAFGLESLGYKQNEIRTRVSEMASFFGLQTWFHKKTTELSGGQKQLLNLASVMVMGPEVLVLDEPTSQLDPIAAGEFLRTLEKINREFGTTIILAEHRLEDVFSMADKVIVMDDGEVIANGMPNEVGKTLKSLSHDMTYALPTPIRIYEAVENKLSCPITIRDGRYWLEEYSKENVLNPNVIPKDFEADNSDKIIEIKDAWFRYEKNMPDVIKGLNVSIKKGELFAITGGNATGKTTALSLISGLNKPYRGDVFIKGDSISKIKNLYNGLIGVLPQNPQSLFVKNTVYLDLMEVLNEKEFSVEEREQMVKGVAVLCRVENLFNSHPYDLSGGEQQRAALAKILLMRPEILVLDEPTKGLDALFKEEFADILYDLKTNGATIVMVSHDVEFCAKYADRCALMFDGSLTSTDTPREFFKGKSFYTTAANRMARTCLPDAVLAEDIILACGGKIEKREKTVRPINISPTECQIKPEKENKIKAIKESKKLTKRTLITTAWILFLIPLTIFAGIYFLGDRKYYFISLLIIFESMFPFFYLFEERKPKARELVVISVLCAIAVAGRAAFFALPQFKPVIAIVIIAGICLGGETGFLVGAVTGFVSNFFFGQGPWTPWQMFAFGIIGFISRGLFKKGILKNKKTSLCVFGFLTTFIIFGGITNPASVIMTQNKITPAMIAASYIAGMPLDLIHALATAFFLWFISEPMIEKLERIKIKYGLYER